MHQPNHLRLCAMLAAVSEAEFSALRDSLDVSDPSLSKYLKALKAADYVTVSKPVVPGRRRTWVALTAAGRRALSAHVAELQRLAAVAAAPPSGPKALDRQQPQDDAGRHRHQPIGRAKSRTSRPVP